jgi:hypothetical protein
MSIDTWIYFYPKCHLNVTCLVVRVISIFKVPIDVWFFLFTSHTAKSKSKLCVSIDVHHFLCKFLRVKCKKLANTLSNIHTGRHDQPLQCQSYISIGSFSLHLERCRFIRQSDIEFWRTKLEPALRNCAGTCFFVQGQKLLHHSLVEAGGKSFPPLVLIESAGCNIMTTQEIWPISKEQKVSAIFSRRPDL